MPETADLTFRRTSDVEAVRQTILDLHAEVRGDFGLMSKPFNSIERFDERLTAYAQRPGWQAVVAHTTSHEPVGFCFGTPLAPNTAWWASMLNPLPDGYTTETGHRTMAFQEICVRKAWRGRGVARRLHDELLDGRPEERVTLLVAPEAGDGKVRAVYESWGYEQIGKQKPFEDSPTFAVMVHLLRQD
ncbi:GNAT family N-acetyltransferase [Streptomyces sp. VNUA116]|uniref:GNAT family N-acetyltransferase n=1 Tax=Streptomyces sp. VNUA116 TaxID=3062449 RepID=UPI0026768D85|nr:GNAT family N-acetyltransferase [Streptomyces sp. VNUA116]WKU42634.1 GNAT family N-acetyltransferase [Streptomyces sp. VNUA116]